MIRRVNDMKLEEFMTEFEGWILCAWITPSSVPCDHFKPEFEGLEAEMGDNLLFVEIDAGEHEEYAEHMKIQAVPTTVVYREGVERARFEGPYSREALKERILKLMQKRRKKK